MLSKMNLLLCVLQVSFFVTISLNSNSLNSLNFSNAESFNLYIMELIDLCLYGFWVLGLPLKNFSFPGIQNEKCISKIQKYLICEKMVILHEPSRICTHQAE